MRGEGVSSRAIPGVIPCPKSCPSAPPERPRPRTEVTLFFRGRQSITAREAPERTPILHPETANDPPQSGLRGHQRPFSTPPPPRRNAGLWCVSTRRDQHKAQKEMWLVSGLQDHRYLSVNKDAKMPVDGPLKKQSSVKTRRYVCNQRHAGFTGSISQPVTEFTYPPPPGRPPAADHRGASLGPLNNNAARGTASSLPAKSKGG